MIGQCGVCGQWHTGEHPITVMTPTTSDREALIAAAEEIEYGHAWISREAASTIIYKHADALTREQREGVFTERDGVNLRGIKVGEVLTQEQWDAVCAFVREQEAIIDSAQAELELREHPQQEAQEAVAFQHKWDDAGETCVHCGDKDWMGDKCSGPRTATPPAPVDVRVPMSRIIELLAQLVNAPQTDDEFDADVIRRDFVMEKVTQLRMAWDELSKAQRALLSGQPAGVDDVARLDWVLSQVGVDDRGVFFTRKDHLDAKKSRAEIDRHIAALGGGVRS